MERDLLERMVQERDEKITALQKTVSIQKEHTTKLQHTLDDSRLKMKQDQTQNKIRMDSVLYDRDLTQAQLNALTHEREKYRDTVFTLSPDGNRGGGTTTSDERKDPQSPRSTTQLDQFNTISSRRGGGSANSTSSNDTTSNPSSPPVLRPHTPARTESAHALYLQSQLYQAMHSISALQIQTKALKQNCHKVVKSLEEDLTETTNLKHQVEVELMSQLTLIEREKGVMEGLLEEKIRIRDSKLRRYEAKIRSMEGLEDGSSEEEDVEDSDDDSLLGGRGLSTMSLTTVEEQEDGSLNDEEEGIGHEQMESALQELEEMSERIIKQNITW